MEKYYGGLWDWRRIDSELTNSEHLLDLTINWLEKYVGLTDVLYLDGIGM